MKSIQSHIIMKHKSPHTQQTLNTQNYSHLQDLYIQHLQNYPLAVCRICSKYLKNMVHVFNRKGLRCIACFAKEQDIKQSYLLFNSRKKYNQNSQLQLLGQFQLLNQIQRNGIDSVELIMENIGLNIKELEYKNYVDHLFQQRAALKQDKLKEDDHKMILKTKKKEQNSEEIKAEKIFQQIVDRQFHVCDYFMGILHQKSSQREIQYVLNYKKVQNQDLQAISSNIKSIIKLQKFSSGLNDDKSTRQIDQFKKKRQKNKQKCQQQLQLKKKQEQDIRQQFQQLKKKYQQEQKIKEKMFNIQRIKKKIKKEKVFNIRRIKKKMEKQKKKWKLDQYRPNNLKYFSKYRRLQKKRKILRSNSRGKVLRKFGV